ncbi:APC family permease [Paractinoplanes durhamensis]|uniref:Amino acid permease n=1 Tax=Paractinoplanes durhamensis TaxID=113563 RepID=A0ABQ3ZBN4_9ACTN|nr:APC family permease [Actinoplanes durhamensis]GIE07191.1 amino acid permease [Actinoplanes durhamensis]
MGTPEHSPHTLAPGRIGAAAVTFFALAATAPIVVLTSVVPAAYARGGGPLVPLTFAAIAVVLLLFAATYAAMVHRAPYAGAMFTYVSRGLGRPAGLAAAWLALASYQAVQLGLYGIVGVATAPLLHSWFRIEAAWWMVAGACWLLVTLLSLIRVEIASGLLALLTLAEIAVVVGFGTANVLDPAGGHLSADAILPSAAVDRPALGLLLAIGVLAFVGFETTGTYAEEAMRPRREPGYATYAAVIVLALLLAFVSWSLGAGAGPGEITALARARGSELVFDLAAARLAPWAVTAGRIALLAGLLAAMLALHNAMSRYLYAMGREKVLPAAYARTAPRTHAPRTASLTISAVAAVALVAAYLAGVRTPSILAQRLTVVGGLGILVVLLATALAALLHLNRVPNGEGTWGRFIAPILSTVALGTLGYLAFWNIPSLLGVPPESALVWSVPVGLVAVAAIGLLHGVALRGRKPVLYAGVGQGPSPVVITPKSPQIKARVPQQREPGRHRPERIDR